MSAPAALLAAAMLGMSQAPIQRGAQRKRYVFRAYESDPRVVRSEAARILLELSQRRGKR